MIRIPSYTVKRKNVSAEKEEDAEVVKKKPSADGVIGTFLLGEKPKTWAPLAEKLEVEVQADPKHPPHSLPALRKFLEDYGEVATKTMNRSSTAELPYDLKDFLPDFSSGSPDTNANFMMTLIWADVGADPVLNVDKSSNEASPVTGEGNILRFVLRKLDPSFASPENNTAVAKMDKWLDLAESKIVHGTAKEQRSAVRRLNVALGKTTFLLGKRAHVVDFVVLSALLQTVGASSFKSKVENWYQTLVSNDLYL